MDAEPRHRFLKATGILRLRSNLNIILRYVSFLTQVLAAISLVIGPRVKHAGRTKCVLSDEARERHQKNL